MDWVQNGVFGKSRTPGDNFGHIPISSLVWKGREKKSFLRVLLQNDKRNINIRTFSFKARNY